jgi:hypothetical protein
MDAVAPLFAAGIDWLEGLLPLVFVVFWLVSQVVNLVRRVAGDGGRPQGRPVAPPRRPAPVEQPDDIRTALERQIEEFLRQSDQRPQPRRPDPAARVVERPEKKKPQRPAPRVADRTPPKAVAAPAKKVSERQLRPLGDAGDDVEEHVRDAFAHDLVHRESSLAPPRAAREGERARAVGGGIDLAAALRDPASLRNLVIVREILERPLTRWE